MNAFIDFIMGPMVWLSVLVCILGLVWRVVAIVREVREKENFIFSYINLYYSLRSIGAWVIPFYPKSARLSPWYYGISYLFHLLIFIVPLFLSAHIVLLDEAFKISWPVLPDGTADLLTLVIVVALIFFAVRRMAVAEVTFLTSAMDFILLFLLLIPFLTGFLAYHQVMGEDAYQWLGILHILSGELILILIPFTRLSHMVTAPLTRAYTGSEFGSIRHARDW